MNTTEDTAIEKLSENVLDTTNEKETEHLW